ncbi:MAG: PAS domain-containing protein, partial [Pantanalinema sp. GBBB05]|nr:PAS domain-containing protein [Pantanalinema sp. GBBB05]
MRQYYWSKPLTNSIEPSITGSLQPPETDLDILRRQHELILNAVGEGVYGLDVNGKVTFVNPAAAKMIGWEIGELIGQSMHTVLHHSKPDGNPYPVHE